MFKKILFPVEKPEDFQHLINKAEFIKQLGGEQIHLMHVVTADEKYTDACAMMESLIDFTALDFILDFTLSYEISTGHAAGEITRIAKEKALDLIYVCSNRGGLISRMLLGSTAADIIRLADTPALIDKTVPNYRCINSVLYATDFKIGADKALSYVKKLASSTRILFVQFVGTRAGDPTSEKQRKEKAEDDLQLLARDLGEYSEVITINSLGRPSAQIKKAVYQNKIDLLILGRGNQRGVKKAIMGSTAEKLVSAVDCLVLMIP